MTFDVASVRPSAPGPPPKGNELLIPFSTAAPAGGLFSFNAPLFGYIIFAYKLVDMSQYQSLNEHLPKWAQTDQFAIDARVEVTPTTDQARLMMQSLLKDRFGFAAHYENRQVPVYALVQEKLGQTGPGLHPHQEDVKCTEKSSHTPPKANGNANPSLYCGMNISNSNNELDVKMIDVTMDQATSFLGGIAGYIGGRENLPIVDQTHLAGRFDLEFAFMKDGAGSESQSDASGPPFTDALKKLLGLNLIKQTGKTSLFVIDHVERPTAN